MVLLLGLAISLLPRIEIDFSLEQNYPSESPVAHATRAHQQLFGRDDNLISIAREGPSDAPELEALATAIADIPGVTRVISPSSFEVLALDDEQGLVTRPLQPGETHPLATGLLVARDGQGAAVVARIANTHNHHAARDPLVAEIERATEEIGGSWYLGGIPVVRTWFVRMMLSDLVLLPASVLISGLFFCASFRDWRYVLMGVGAILAGATAALGGYAATASTINIFTPSFMAVVVVVGTSDVVHLLHRYMDWHEILGDGRAAARRAADEVGMACALTSTSTAIGFLALLSTDIPPIQRFGLATGTGVILTYLVTFLLVPPILGRLAPPSPRAGRYGHRSAGRLEQLGRTLLRRPWACLVGSALVTLFMLAAASRIHVDHKILEDIRGEPAFAAAQDFQEAHMGAMLPLQLDLRFSEGDPRDPEVLAAITRMSDWLEEQELVGDALCLGDLVRSLWPLLEPTAGPSGLPTTREAISQVLLMVSLSGEDPVPSLLTTDSEGQTRSRIMTRVRDQGHQATVELVEQIEARAEAWLAPHGVSTTITGEAWLAQQVNASLTRQFAGSFGIALGLIAVVWLVATRSPTRTLTALVPNVLPLIGLLGTLGLTGMALKPSSAMVLSIGLGIAVDDTIHFLAAYEHARREGADAHTAALRAYRTAGRSMMDTSVLLVAGFLCLLGSGFLATSTFGWLTACTMVFAMLSDFFVLGPLLLLIDRR